MAAEMYQGLEELLKVPKEKQHSTILEKLKARRKELADKFFDKTLPVPEKMKIQDELALLHDYFGMKPIRKYGSGGPGKKVVTVQERADNCDAFIAYLKKKFPEMPERAMIDYLPMVWGSP